MKLRWFREKIKLKKYIHPKQRERVLTNTK